jgi:hypothetical protein
MTDERTQLLTLAGRDIDSAREIIRATTDDEFGHLLRGLLGMYTAAVRETRTQLGVLAVGVLLEEINETEHSADRRNAAALILAFNATLDYYAADGSAFRDFGAQNFNDTLDLAPRSDRVEQLVLAIAAVWRTIAPELHTPEGLEILRRVQW